MVGECRYRRRCASWAALPAQRAVLERLYYLSNILHGDLGYSMNYRRPVFDILNERFPRTLLLAGVGYGSAS